MINVTPYRERVERVLHDAFVYKAPEIRASFLREELFELIETILVDAEESQEEYEPQPGDAILEDDGTDR